MGMDLVPRYRAKVDCLHFNWYGWGHIGDFLENNGADTRHLAGTNDGYYIPARICREYADVIEENKGELFRSYMDDHKGHPLLDCGEITWVEKRIDNIIEFFRKCGGCRQF
jgi:hypothetical protein